MKKLLIILSVILLAGIGYFTYNQWGRHANLTSWSFIPVDASMVFELDLLEDYHALKGYPIWHGLSETRGISRINNGITFLDSLNGKGGFSSIFKEAPILVSMHKVASDRFDFLFVLDIQNISQNTFVSASIGRLQEDGYRFKTRSYNGYKISEVSKDGQLFTYIFYKNYLLASFTPYLVEDAIRTIEGDQIPFEKVYVEATTQTNGLARVYVNYPQTSRLISSMTLKEVTLPLKNGEYAINMDSSFFSISGFSSEVNSQLLSHKSEAAAFDMAEVVPQNTAYIYHISSSDFSEWKARHMAFLSENEPEIKEIQDSLKKSFDFSPYLILDLIDEEIGIVDIESANNLDQKRLCILELKDTEESLDFFERLTERIAQSKGDSVYSESYSENEIRYLPITNFPQTFLGSIAGSFDQCFYINHRNYLIFSNDLQELKSVISDINNENTWGKSVRANEFLERTNNTANLSLFVNIPRSLTSIRSRLKDSWQEHVSTHYSSYKSFEYAAFQFSFLDNRFFTNITLTQPTKKSKVLSKTSADSGLRFASNLTSKPFLLKTHAHKDFDILVQDSTNTIYYLDAQQNTLWTRTINGQIVGNVVPLDYYKNGKIQYILATSEEVHILDRTGSSIPGYPKSISQSNIQHLNVIDYDLSRNYRLALTDESGTPS